MVLRSEPLLDDGDKKELQLKLKGINDARQQLLQIYPNQRAEILHRMKKLEEKVIRAKIREKRKQSIFFGFGMTGAGILIFVIAAVANLDWPILMVIAVGLFFSGLFTAGLNVCIMSSEEDDDSEGDSSDTK